MAAFSLELPDQEVDQEHKSKERPARGDFIEAGIKQSMIDKNNKDLKHIYRQVGNNVCVLL